MTKALEIESCADCPSYGHSGGFTEGGSYPLCMASKGEGGLHPGYNGTTSILPWKAAVSERTGKTFRDHLETIPDWCPLEDYPKLGSSRMLIVMEDGIVEAIVSETPELFADVDIGIMEYSHEVEAGEGYLIPQKGTDMEGNPRKPVKAYLSTDERVQMSGLDLGAVWDADEYEGEDDDPK